MKPLAWLVAAFILAAGVTAIVAPEFVLGLRSMFATRTALLVISVIRIAVGVVLIMSAPASRMPKVLQVAGAVMLLVGMATPLFGVERTKAVLEWEAMQGPALVRAAGVGVAAIGGFLVFVLTPRRIPL